MRTTVVTTAVLLALAGTATAYVKEYNASVSLQSTNFSTSVTIPKFDTSLGTLQSIEFILEGHVEGVVRFENQDANAATVIAKLQAELELQRPGGTTLLVTIPVWDNSPGEDLPGYDGTPDFLGLSGRTYDDPNTIYGDKTENQTTLLLADLALFSASFSGENIILPVIGTGTSSASGPGNITSSFSTNASADVTVRYTYIPEPGMIGLLALGGLFGLRRRWLR